MAYGSIQIEILNKIITSLLNCKWQNYARKYISIIHF